MSGRRDEIRTFRGRRNGAGVETSDNRLLAITRDTVDRTCDVDQRRALRVREGGAGVADVPSICLKDDGDVYAWGTIATLADIPGVTTAFSDDDFGLYNEADNTKIAEFDASGITTGTTRTYDLPDADGELALVANTFSTVTVRTNSITLSTGTNNGVAASCLAGELVVGCGGGVSLGGANVQVIRTIIGATTCEVVGRNDSGGDRTLTAEAVCIT